MPIIINPYRVAPSIVFKGSNYNVVPGGTVTVTIPAHNAGDLILGYCVRQSNTKATLPGGWTSIATAAGANSFSTVAGYKFAASSGETSGSWTNGQCLMVEVYSGVTAVGDMNSSVAAGSTITWPSLSLQVTDGSSWVAMFGSASASVPDTPTGGTSRAVGSGGGVTVGVRAVDTDGGVPSWASVMSAAGSSINQAISVELKV